MVAPLAASEIVNMSLVPNTSTVLSDLSIRLEKIEGILSRLLSANTVPRPFGSPAEDSWKEEPAVDISGIVRDNAQELQEVGAASVVGSGGVCEGASFRIFGGSARWQRLGDTDGLEREGVHEGGCTSVDVKILPCAGLCLGVDRRGDLGYISQCFHEACRSNEPAVPEGLHCN